MGSLADHFALGSARGQAAKCRTRKPHDHREKLRFCTRVACRRGTAGVCRASKSSLAWREIAKSFEKVPPRLEKVAQKHKKHALRATPQNWASPQSGRSDAADAVAARPHPPCADGACDGGLEPAVSHCRPPSASCGWMSRWSARAARSSPSERPIHTRWMGTHHSTPFLLDGD